MAGACIYLFWWEKNDISGLIEDSDAENTKAIASLNRTFHLSPYENILTIALINIHYLYNNLFKKRLGINE